MEWYTHACGLALRVERGKASEIREVRFLEGGKLGGSFKTRECPRCGGELPGFYSLDRERGAVAYKILLSDGSQN